MKITAVALILLLAFFGLADSAYLAEHIRTGTPLICDFQGFSDCNTVAESPYSRVLGVPLADFGVAFYGLLFILAALELAYPMRYVRRAIQGLAAAGLIASAYFMFLQFSVINAVCIYCTVSAVISLLIFVLAYFIEPFAPHRRAIEMPPWPGRPPRTSTRLVLPPPLT